MNTLTPRLRCDIEAILDGSELYPRKPISQRDLDERYDVAPMYGRNPTFELYGLSSMTWGDEDAVPLDGKVAAAILGTLVMVCIALGVALWWWSRHGAVWPA